MNSSRHGRRKPVSEEKRERDVFLLYGAAFRDVPHLDDFGPDPEIFSLPGDFVPRPSPDSILTGLAQLATYRLGAGRAMISLIDDQRQHILAEATPNMSLHPETSGDAPSTLWLGSVSIPRTRGTCEKVLGIELQDFTVNEFPTLIIRDLRESVYDADQTYLSGKNVRFYAGAPLISPAGAIVGSVCVLDDLPRPDGLSQEHHYSLRDIAQSIIDYLHNYTIKVGYGRGELFTRGLISFSEGASDLLPFGSSDQHESGGHPGLLSGMSSSEMASPYEELGDPFNHLPQIISVTAPATVRIKGGRQRSMKRLQETILPMDARSMFSRAANVMMVSSNLDGVLILDASVAANRNRQQPGSQEQSPETGTSSTGECSKTSSSDEGYENSPHSARSNQDGMSKTCQVLGYAASDRSEFGENGFKPVTFLETDLARMLHDFPNGKVITFSADGLSLSSTDETGASSGASSNFAFESLKRKGSRANRHSNAVQKMLPGARSVAFVPFWDYERSRWFAGCLCWSNSAHRLLSASVDLAYFKVFSHSIMRELSRLDAMALNQAKTTFVASISHELRSPLHGILGTLEFIKDTPLDSFQTSMLNSLNACSQTLLDTINHVMDYAKISEIKRIVSSRRLKSTNTIRLSSKPLKNRRSKAGAFDLGIATEEVVEAVFSGSSYVPVSGAFIDDTPSSPLDAESDHPAKRKICYIVLDIAYEEDWIYCFPVGSWRRIVMNIFGNAIKYTESGHIHVSLRVNDGSKATGAPTTITLQITDSGSGMSPQFLANKAFQPFSQENSFAPGTGLGLSIVKQIIETNGGKIEVSSHPSVGTKVTVKLALTKPESIPTAPPQRSQYTSFLPTLEGRRICILQGHQAPSSERANLSHTNEGLIRFTNGLAQTLTTHLKMRVVRTANWEGHDAEIVIVPEFSFEYLATIRRARVKGTRAPVTIFIAMDALEAATLRSDARVQRKESVVEIMTQPCGPYKLAYILNRCLDRQLLPTIPPDLSDATMFPVVGVSNVATPWFPYRVAETVATQRPTTLPLRHAPTASQILIVDDNLINRKLLVAFMNKHNYSYEEAENGLEALEKYRRDPPKFKVVLMDMSMPIMDGMTSTRAIRQHEENNSIARCRIVALTGLASASARLEALSSGVDHFLTKPVNFKALAELIMKENKTREQVGKTEVFTKRETSTEREISKEREASRDIEEKNEAGEVMGNRQQEVSKKDAQEKEGEGIAGKNALQKESKEGSIEKESELENGKSKEEIQEKEGESTAGVNVHQ